MPDISSPAEVKIEEEGSTGSSGHRVLIFAQLKSYLDIVEADVLAPAGISYLRLDGRCAAALWPSNGLQSTVIDAATICPFWDLVIPGLLRMPSFPFI